MKHVGFGSGAAPSAAGRSPRLRALAAAGFVATLAAIAVTTLAAALVGAVGVDFEIPDGGEAIPLPAFAVVTGFFSLVGIGIAAVLLRWTTRPVKLFVATAVSLTAISFVAPVLSGANTASVVTLLGLHVVAAAVVIPTLARTLRVTSAALPARKTPTSAATLRTKRQRSDAEDTPTAQLVRDA